MPGVNHKVNQDSLLILKTFANEKMNSVLAIFDGHGNNGHHVSGFLRRNFESSKHFYKGILERNYKEGNFKDVEEILKYSIDEIVNSLEKSKIDTTFSGTTACISFIQNKTIYTANIGDSRAIIGSFRNGKWIAKPLSIDHKPEREEEAKRILKTGGRIEQLQNLNGEKLGPLRVWLKYEDTPGLAMTRSIGDSISHCIGVTNDPGSSFINTEILKHSIDDDDKFIVVASDGIWEFLENEEVVKIVAEQYIKRIPEIACEKLVREASIKWSAFSPSCDDITCIIAFFR